ncbi:ATP-binding protein [Archangium gephyra]|nr:ATP-binding protein [Archangium gephyra]
MTELDMREEFLRGQQARLATIKENRQAWLESFPEDAIKWMLVVPSWTPELARVCGLPSGDQDVGRLFRRMRDKGLCESRSSGSPEAEVFWMPESMKAEQIERLGGVECFGEAIVEAGMVLDVLARRGGHVPSAVRRWAALASKAESVEKLEKALNGHLEKLLPMRVPRGETPWEETTDEKLGEALRWVEAARRLEPFFGPKGVAAIARAWRWLELIQLRAEDMQHLHDFVARDEQLRAFERLLEGKDDCWALHYIGQAGVGKTMLVRHLVSRLIPKLGGCVARIDFDRLSPDYPSQAPWLLVEQLAEQLRLQDQNGLANRMFKELDYNVLRFRESATRKDWVSEVPDEILAQQLAGPFAAALSKLPQPTVLVLDTCEELARARTDGRLPSNVRVTFFLLEQMHARHPGLRVIFCGRHALASAGAGWNMKGAPTELPERKYLRLHEIRGFTRQEAQGYFERVFEHAGRAEEPQLRELLPPILERSQEASTPSRFTWMEEADAPCTEIERFSPFKLWLYVNWVLGASQLTVEEILAEAQFQYAKYRIVDRIQHRGLEALLPTISLLGRFDRELLACAWRRTSKEQFDEEAFEDAFRELVRQEWLGRDGQFYEVEQFLCDELSDCLVRSRENDWNAAWHGVVDTLDALTTSEPFERLQVFYFSSLVRLLLLGPRHALSSKRMKDAQDKQSLRRASAWWEVIERRVAESGQFDWGRELCESLLAKDGPFGPEPHTGSRAKLRAAVLGTHAATLAHGWRSAESAWECLRCASIRRLRFRANAGLVVSARLHQRKLRAEQVDDIWAQVDASYAKLSRGNTWEWGNPGLQDEQLLASYVAALEAVLEVAEWTGQPRLAGTIKEFEQLQALLKEAGASRELRAFALVLGARNVLLRGFPSSKARKSFSEAMKLVGLGPTPQRWLDWNAPGDLGARIRLEYVRAMYPAFCSAEEVLETLGWKDRSSSAAVFLLSTSNIDQDRFNAALLTLAGAVDAGVLQDLGFLIPTRVDLPVECNAHRSFPPAFVKLAELKAMDGRVEEAQDGFSAQARGSERRAIFERGAEAADLAALRVALRMRDFEAQSSTSFERLLLAPTEELSSELLLLTAALYGQMRPDFVERLCGPERLRRLEGEAAFRWSHACWRSVPVLDEDSAGKLLHWASEQLFSGLLSSPPSGFWACSCLLDAVESHHLAERWSRTADLPSREDCLAAVEAWCKAWSKYSENETVSSEKIVRLRLRLHALRGNACAGAPLPEVLRKGMERLGKRRFAEMAREEGELLALRLPRQGSFLLELSRFQFLQVGDVIGAFLAGVCAALARSHFELLSLPVLLEELAHDYQVMLAMGIALPPWAQLQDAARSSPHELLNKRLVYMGWKPWLLRLMLCMAQSSAILERDFQRLDLLFQESRWRYGGYFPTGGPWMSTELEALWAATRRLAGISRVLEEARGAVPSPPCLMVQRIPARPTESAREGERPLPVEKDVVGPAFRIEVSFESSPPEDGDAFDIDPRASYEAVRRSLPDRLREKLHQVARSHAGEGVTLRVTPDASEPCWEYILGPELALEEGGAPWMFRRVVAEGWRACALRSEPLRCVRLLCAGTFLRSFAKKAWDSWKGSVQFMDASPGSESNGEVDVVHVIASAVPTARGVRLQLVGEAYYEQQSRSREVLIEGRELLRTYPNLRVVILQGVPLHSEQWSASERFQAGLLRWFAASLAQSGALSAVVVLPPLPPGISSQVLADLTRWLNEKDWPCSLDRCLPELRMRVQDGVDIARPEDRMEAAMDLCLYLPPELVRDCPYPLLQPAG